MSELARRTPRTEELALFPDEEFAAFDRLFDRLRQQFLTEWAPFTIGRATDLRFSAPAVDVQDRGDAYEIRADLPGFPKDAIDVRVQDHRVHVHAEQTTKTEAKEGGTYLRRERAFRGFDREFELPESVASDQVRAEYAEGVLTLTVPKVHPVAEKKIPIA